MPAWSRGHLTHSPAPPLPLLSPAGGSPTRPAAYRRLFQAPAPSAGLVQLDLTEEAAGAVKDAVMSADGHAGPFTDWVVRCLGGPPERCCWCGGQLAARRSARIMLSYGTAPCRGHSIGVICPLPALPTLRLPSNHRSPAHRAATAAPKRSWLPGASSAAPWTAPPAACSPMASSVLGWSAGQMPACRPAGVAGTAPQLQAAAAAAVAALQLLPRAAATAAAPSGGSLPESRRSRRRRIPASLGGRPQPHTSMPTRPAALTMGRTAPSATTSAAVRCEQTKTAVLQCCASLCTGPAP